LDLPPIQAAAPIDTPDEQVGLSGQEVVARQLPKSSSYFTGLPNFTDDLIDLKVLYRKYETLPRLPTGEAERIAWKTPPQYRETVGENVPSSKYHQLVELMQSMSTIHPSVMPKEVKAAIEKYKRDINPFENKPNPIIVDRFGRALGVGKRKTSTARAWVVEGEGQVLVNGKTLVDAFGRVHDRESAIWALKATDRIDKYNVWALVEGGGTTGQAEAMTMAVAKGLLAHEPALKPALRRAGCVTRDPRNVERKKAGRVKARKRPTWVKR